MKLQQKLMALAIMGIAAAAPAHAAITNGNTGNGELFLSVLDTAGQKGYTLDLNVTMNTFLTNIATAGFSYTFSADSLMTSFLNGVLAANKPNLVWAVGAEDGAGINRYITTSTNINLATPNTNGTIGDYNNNVDSYLSSTNAKTSLTPLTPNSFISSTSDGNAFTGSAGALLSNWGGAAVGFSTGGLIGTANHNNLYLVSQTSTSDFVALGTNQSILQGGNQVYGTLGLDGQLVFQAQAVPEADTWAMFAAGLLVVGAIARRRMAA